MGLLKAGSGLIIGLICVMVLYSVTNPLIDSMKGYLSTTVIMLIGALLLLITMLVIVFLFKDMRTPDEIPQQEQTNQETYYQ